MITINIAGFLTDFTAGRSQITLDGSPGTVGEALQQLWELHRGLRDRVVNEQGQVRPHVNIFLNGENIRRKEALETALAGNAEITILPSVSGGATKITRPILPALSAFDHSYGGPSAGPLIGENQID